ncbi:MAG: hypothetical protein ACRBFS_16770 [Aureispira sp.]
MQELILNKAFYNQVKYFLENKKIDQLNAYITAPEQLLFVSEKVAEEGMHKYRYSVYNYIKQSFLEYPDLLEYLLENKFHEAIIMQSEGYHYLTPSDVVGTYTGRQDFCDEDFIQLASLFTKHQVAIDDLLSSVYYCSCLTSRSIKWLLEQGIDIHNERYKQLLSSPPLNNDTLYNYEKVAFLLEAGMSANSIHVDEYCEDIEEHVLDIICSSYCFHIPYLFLYIEHGARRDGFMHRLIGLKSKKGLKFKYTLVKFYLEKNPTLVNEYSAAGLTPLQLAVAHADVRMVELLLAYGADTTLTTQNKRIKTVKKRKIQKNSTALEIAERIEDIGLIERLKSKEPTSIPPINALTIPALDPSFHQTLLQYIAKVVDFTEAGGFKYLHASFDKGLLELKLPVIPSIVHDLALANWGELKAHHYQLLHIALVLGGQRFSWSKEGTGGVIEFASWIDVLNKNILCRYEDMGTAFVSPNKKNVRLNFASTYNSYKVFRLNLTLEQFLEKTFQSLGVGYWMFCFISPKYDLMKTIPFFEEQLKEATGISLKELCKK